MDRSVPISIVAQAPTERSDQSEEGTVDEEWGRLVRLYGWSASSVSLHRPILRPVFNMHA